MDIHPIHTDAQHAAALAEVEALMDAEPGTLRHDRLEVLSVLVDAYEREHHAIEAPDPIEAIKFRMEQLGLTRRDLEPILGTRARVAEVLNRKRRLTLEMIRGLHRDLGVPAEVLIAE